MLSLFRPAAMALALLMLAPAAAACFAGDDHGDCSGNIIDVGGGIYYVITGKTPDNGWDYLETNGEPGLQRGGISHDLFPPDICQSTENPDSRWY